MLYSKRYQYCQNCEYLRIDNFCLIKGDYILSKATWKINKCKSFVNKYSDISNQILSEKKFRIEQMKTMLANTTIFDKTNSEE